MTTAQRQLAAPPETIVDDPPVTSITAAHLIGTHDFASFETPKLSRLLHALL